VISTDTLHSLQAAVAAGVVLLRTATGFAGHMAAYRRRRRWPAADSDAGDFVRVFGFWEPGD